MYSSLSQKNESLSQKNESFGKYKFIIFVTFIMALASIVTFSLFLKNIYQNMDEIRRTEIEFRGRIESIESRYDYFDRRLSNLNKQ